MKQAQIFEPKQRNAFRNKYLTAIFAVVALLISSAVCAQLDSTKYSPINGYGFRYKRMAFDSILMVPRSTSPHVPWRAGAIRYKAADSTLQLWTGTQWNSILTGVGNGIDTAYAYNDSTIAIETPDQDFFITLRGSVYANATGSGDTLLTASNTIKRLDHDATITFSINANKILMGVDTISYVATKSDISGVGNSQVTENKIYYRGEQYVNHVVDDDGTIDADTSVNITDYMPIEGSTSVTISSSTGDNITVYGWTYDATFTPISEIRAAALIGTQLATYTFTTPANAAYINIYCKISGQDFRQYLRIQSTNTITYFAPVLPSQFTGTATEKLQKALNFQRWTTSHVEFTGYMELDSALIMSSGNTLVLNNGHIRLKSGTHDNLIRNEAVQYPTQYIYKRGNRDIKIIGVGNAIFQGSDEDWGSDNPTGVNGQRWRSHGIRFANVDNFQITGLKMKGTNANPLDIEQSRYGLISDIYFDQQLEHLNQGGVELIRGVHDVIVQNIRGTCQDDIVAINNIKANDSLHILGLTIYEPYRANLDMENIIVRNIQREPASLHQEVPQPLFGNAVRLLCADSLKIHDITIDGVTGYQNIFINDPGFSYIRNTRSGVDDIYNITISNATNAPVYLFDPIRDCNFTNISPTDTTGVFPTCVPTNGSLNITRKYYNQSEEFIANVGTTNWIELSNLFETNGNDIEHKGNVAANFRVGVVNANSAGHANFFAKNDLLSSFLNGISGSTATPFAGIGTDNAYLFGNGAGGFSISQNTSGSKINFINNGVEQMRITETGIGINETTPQDALQITNFDGSGNVGSTILLKQSSSDAKRGNLDFYKSRGTPSAPTAVSDGDATGFIRSLEHDGTSYLVNGAIGFAADGTPSSGITPGRVSIFARDASGNFNENMRISADRSVTIQSLAGVGVRMATVDANGKLGEQAIPSGADGNGIYGGSGSLTGTTVITGAGNSLVFTSTRTGALATMNVSNTSTGGALIANASGAGTGIDAQSFSGYGGNIFSTSGPGLQVSSSSNTGLIVSSTTGVPAEIQTTPASTNTTVPLLSAYRKSSGTALANIAGAFDMYNENAGGTDVLSTRLISKLTTATASSEVSQLEIWGVNAGTLGQKFTFLGTGQLQGNAYGTGTFTGTATASIQTTSAGAFIEGPLVASGTWTATLTAVTNVTGTPTLTAAHYTRIGNEVTYSIEVIVDPTASATVTEVRFSLPIASNLAAAGDILGTLAGETTGSSAVSGHVEVDAANDEGKLQFTSQSVNNHTLTITGHYTIFPLGG